MKNYVNEFITLFCVANGGFLSYQVPTYENVNSIYIYSNVVDIAILGGLFGGFRVYPNTSFTINGNNNEIWKPPIFIEISNVYNNDGYAYIILKRLINAEL